MQQDSFEMRTAVEGAQPKVERMKKCRSILKRINRKIKTRNLLRLANFILVDVRLLFIIMSVYITISTAITSAANNEAAADANGNGTFDLTSRPEHNDLPVREISNAVLWNCREKSITRTYYTVLYGALSVAFALILSMFILTRLSILWGNMRPGLRDLNKAMWHIQIINKLRNYLEYKREQERQIAQHKTSDHNQGNKFGDDFEAKIAKWSREDALEKLNSTLTNKRLHDQGSNISKLPEILSKWSEGELREQILEDTEYSKGQLCSMLIIPFMETVLLIVSLPFILTTYDINPVGCLVGPDEDTIAYNNITGRVELKITKSVFAYQKAALIVFIILMGPIPFFAAFLLYKYIRIARGITKSIEEKLKTPSKVSFV